MGDTTSMATITSEQEAPPRDRLHSLALTARQKFLDGHRMTIRENRTVHAVDSERWVGGELVPQPLCHAPVYGWSPEALRPTRKPITCQRCIHKLAAPDEILLPMGAFQPPLFPVKMLQAA